MKQRALLAGVSMLALAAATAVPADASHSFKGWYMSLEGGAVWIQDTALWDFEDGSAPSNLGNVEFDTGWAVMGAIGYRWDSNWRLEFELAYRANDGTFTEIGCLVCTDDLEVTQFTQMVNVLYDIPLSSKWALSLGAGVGGDLVSLDINDPGAPDLDDDYVLAGQLIAQLTYRATKRLEIFLDYRYLVADDPEFAYVSGGETGFLTFEDEKHTALIGLRYDLSPDEEPLPPVAYVPPPQAAPAPKQYIIFFGWNKYNLTQQAQETVAQAASSAKQSGSASILVVGHADTSGSARYNQKLSERRSNTVSNELVRNGIDPSSITAMGKGENELLVTTADGVREPQNRRVEVNL
jgi:outer membrane protein OmpA-like peptidoglycan-associated protein